MAIDRIILLTSAEEAAILGTALKQHNPTLDIIPAHDRETVIAACAAATAGTRLLSFCSPVIVPGSALRALPGPAYNFHPGPPSRPGRYPSIFALYDGDRQFGVTVHEMEAKVDSGAIVAAEWFEIAADCDLATLEKLTYGRLAAVFHRLARRLALVSLPLPHIACPWSGHKTTLAEAMALAEVTAEMNETEIARRRRACGSVRSKPTDPGWPS